MLLKWLGNSLQNIRLLEVYIYFLAGIYELQLRTLFINRKKHDKWFCSLFAQRKLIVLLSAYHNVAIRSLSCIKNCVSQHKPHILYECIKYLRCTINTLLRGPYLYIAKYLELFFSARDRCKPALSNAGQSGQESYLIICVRLYVYQQYIISGYLRSLDSRDFLISITIFYYQIGMYNISIVQYPSLVKDDASLYLTIYRGIFLILVIFCQL